MNRSGGVLEHLFGGLPRPRASVTLSTPAPLRPILASRHREAVVTSGTSHRTTSRDGRASALRLGFSEREQDLTDPMSDQNRVTQPPEEADSAEPVDVESAEISEDRDEGPVRRPLIRATLKHPEGTPPAPRQPPVFTMHQQERGGSSPARGPNRNGRFVRDSGQANKKKGSRDRSGQGASQNASMKGSGPGGKKRSPRSDGSGQHSPPSGNRAPSSRRDKGRPR